MADLLGYVASGAVLITFLMHTMRLLRLVAILSNILFVAYASVEHIYPVLALHVVLLPVNIWRLCAPATGGAAPSTPSAAPVRASRRAATPYALWFAAGVIAGLISPLPVLVLVGKSEASKLMRPFAAAKSSLQSVPEPQLRDQSIRPGGINAAP